MGPGAMSQTKKKSKPKRKVARKAKSQVAGAMTHLKDGGSKKGVRVAKAMKSEEVMLSGYAIKDSSPGGSMNIGTRSGFDVRSSIGKIVGVKGPITLERVRKGLPANAVIALSDNLKLTQGAMIKSLNVGKQTFQRRMEAGVLNESESDRVVRYAQLLALATELFEDDTAAARWLKTPAPALDNETPLAHAKTEMGARNVERLIGRLEHGIPT